MNIITTQVYIYTCKIKTPQPKGCSYLNSVGICTYFILICVTLSLMIKGFNNISACKGNHFIWITLNVLYFF